MQTDGNKSSERPQNVQGVTEIELFESDGPRAVPSRISGNWTQKASVTVEYILVLCVDIWMMARTFDALYSYCANEVTI